MQDIQKKLDELIQLREQLVHLTNNFELANIKNISGTPVYIGKVQVIAKRHQDQQLETKLVFKNTTKDVQNKVRESQRLAKKSQQAVKESQRLARESKRLAKESQQAVKESRWLARESKRLAKENIKNFNNRNLTTTKHSVCSIELLIDKITIDIDQTTKELIRLATLDEIYNQCNTDEYLKQFLTAYLTSNLISTVDNATSLITFKIKSICDWKYPGMQLHPISKEWIDCMITADPLYLIQHNHNDMITSDKNLLVLPKISLIESIESFPLDYQRRLRIYNIKDQDFSALPQAVFGCISCHNFLNQFTLVDIENYLTKVFKLLKPGGTLVCTLNFNYVESTVNLVKYDFFKYAVDVATIKFFENNGYEIVSTVDLSANDWSSSILIEARRPGVLATSKAHQVLGSIIEK